MAEEIVKLKLDVIFKKMFTEPDNRDLLIGFIADILDLDAQTIDNVVIENSEITPDEIDGKFTRFDMKLTASGRLINVEIQVNNRGDFEDRSLYYWAQRFGNQLKKGDKYSDISETISINIVNFKMFKTESYYSKYTMADLENMNILTDKCAIYYFELPKIDMTAANAADKRKTWMQLINAESAGDLDMLSRVENPKIQKGINVIRDYSADKQLREMARRREETLREEQSALYTAEQRGIKYGLTQGLIQGRNKGMEELAKLLRLRGIPEETLNAAMKDIADEKA
jgi:predicted transposase/invertase (TIGR01784 family)